MATTNINALLYGAVSGQGVVQRLYPCNNTTSAVNEGDLVYWDASAHLIKSITNDTTAAAGYAGFAAQPSTVSSNLDNGAILPPNMLVVNKTYAVGQFKTTVGDTYHHNDPLYIGADAQTVTSTVGGLTQVLGYVQLPPGVSSLSGAVGVRVGMYIKSTVL